MKKLSVQAYSLYRESISFVFKPYLFKTRTSFIGPKEPAATVKLKLKVNVFVPSS